MARVLLAATVVIGGGIAAHAQSPGYTISSTFGGGNGTYTLGNVFTVGPTNVTVNALGYYDGGNGGSFNESHDLALFDSNNTMVAGSQTTLAAGTSGTEIGDYRYSALGSSITLLAGHTYTVAGTTNGGDTFANVAGPNISNDNRLGFYTSNYTGSSDITTYAGGSYYPGTEAYQGPNLLLAGSALSELTVQNAGFEDNAASFTDYPGYANSGSNPAIAGWTSNNTTSGINGYTIGAGQPFANQGDIPEGSNVAFLQSVGTPTSISQSIAGFVAGHTYAVTFYDNFRASYDAPNLTVTIGGQQIYSSAITDDTNGDYNYITTDIFTAQTSGPMLLTFTGATPNAGYGDSTVLLDKIKVLQIATGSAAAPEPGALALAAGGIGLLPIGLLRRRSARRKG